LCDVSFFHIYTELIEIQREICLGLYNHKFLFREDDDWRTDSRIEGVNRAKLKFININTTTSRVSVKNKNKSAREGAKQIISK
jgi:hypothetical protein